MDSASYSKPAAPAASLKENAISFASNVVIGVASAAPAYSLAAALPALVAAAKFGVPAVVMVAFIPILFIAAAYYHLNRADPDCGTTFSWVTRAMGPYAGFMGGWAIIATDILVMPGLAQVAAQYTLHIFDVEQASPVTVTMIGVIWIVLMTAICYFGIELSAHMQKALLAAEVSILFLFSAVALTKVYAGGVAGGKPVALEWFNPFSVENRESFTIAMLVAVFIYWGWDTGASVNEETENPKTAPARAAIVATILLVALYVVVAIAAIAFAEPGLETYNGDDFLAPLATTVLGAGVAKLLVLAVLSSTAACTQTTILPAARTAISMARAGAVPRRFADVHPRYLTPSFATLAMGVVSIVWYVGLIFLAGNNVLQDSVTSTAIGIAFYYGLTGFACVLYYRRELGKNLRNFLFMGVVPALGGVITLVLLLGALVNYSSPDQNKTSFAGIGAAVLFGVGGLLIGVVLMLFARFASPAFFSRKREVVDPMLVGLETPR